MICEGGIEQLGEPILGESYIAVYDGKPFGVRLQNAGVYGMREAEILGQGQNARSERGGELRAAVRGSVIDDENLARWKALAERRDDAIFKEVLPIEVRYQYGNWRGHARLARASGMVSRGPQRGKLAGKARARRLS
jgi:hypothetical protein